jgi:hypothetical protein
MLTTNPLTVKLWEMKTWTQAVRMSYFGKMASDGAVYMPEEFKGRDVKGDTVTFAYAGKMTGVPRGEGGTLDGNEQALDLQSHSMVVNESRDAVLIPNSGIEPLRTKVNMEKVVNELLPKRAIELLDGSAFQQLAGVNPTSFTIDGTTYASTADKLHLQGHNTIVAPTTNRIIRAAGAANDQSLTSADTMTLQLLDYALEKNDLSEQPVEACAEGFFHLYISPADAVNLKHDAGSAVTWYNNQLAQIQGGKEDQLTNRVMNQKIFLGTYGNVKIWQAPRVAFGANSGTSAVITSVRRNVLVGKDALSFASPYGGRPSDTDVPLKIINQLKDYDKYKGIGFEMLYGLKKMSPSNKEDVGVIVIGTYAAAHA